MKKHNKRGPSYLDVAEYMLSGPFSPKFSPAIRPVEHELPEVLLFFNNRSVSEGFTLESEPLFVRFLNQITVRLSPPWADRSTSK